LDPAAIASGLPLELDAGANAANVGGQPLAARFKLDLGPELPELVAEVDWAVVGERPSQIRFYDALGRLGRSLHLSRWFEVAPGMQRPGLLVSTSYGPNGAPALTVELRIDYAQIAPFDPERLAPPENPGQRWLIYTAE
jgi:hypothetical protein